ncbi:MAG: hypothetical protein H0U18_09190 [Pyrinomonadaceae bacterium]|nr:hypothetical protein [Pyrinomonadaceae bacterium]
MSTCYSRMPLVLGTLLLGVDIRTAEQKAVDKRQEERSRQWALRHLASRYNREEIYKAIWSEPIQHVAKRYNLSDVFPLGSNV